MILVFLFVSGYDNKQLITYRHSQSRYQTSAEEPVSLGKAGGKNEKE
jgi:hypothetical protein